MQNRMKKNILLLVAALLLPLTVQAQQYKREDFSFKSTKVKNAEGEMTHVKVGTYAGGRLIQEFTIELPGEPMETTAESVGEITEPDLNFDGYPDVRIYLGYFGAHPNDTYSEVLLWSQEQHRFVQAEGYSDLPDPMEDEKTHLLTTSLRSGPDHRVTDYYRWNGNKIEHLLSHTWAIEDDDDVDIIGVLNLPCYRIRGDLDGKIPVIIVFQKTEDDILGGYIYYPRAKRPAPILIVGSVTHYGGTDYYHLREYQPDGIISGVIRLKVKEEDGYMLEWEGTWTNPKTKKEMKIASIFFDREIPKWFTQSVLKPEDPGNIGREYSFQEWNEGAQTMMGGDVSFRAAGKNKVHFHISNVRHNIAEGSSEEGRPAVLNGNVFEYREVNECHYGFRAAIFPRFMVINTITDHQSLGCFGMGATFDGVYVKIKQ